MRAELVKTTQPFSSPQQSAKDAAAQSGDPLFAMLLQMMGSVTPQVNLPIQDANASTKVQTSRTGESRTVVTPTSGSTQAATLKSMLSGVAQGLSEKDGKTSVAQTEKRSVATPGGHFQHARSGTQSTQVGLASMEGAQSSLPLTAPKARAVADAGVAKLSASPLSQKPRSNTVQTNQASVAATSLGAPLAAAVTQAVKPTATKAKPVLDLTQSGVPSKPTADAAGVSVQQSLTATLPPLSLHAVMFKAAHVTPDSSVQPSIVGDKLTGHIGDSLVNQPMSNPIPTVGNQPLTDVSKAIVDVRDPSAIQDFAKVLSGQISAGNGQLQVQVKPEGMGDILISVSKHDSGLQVHIEANNLQTMSWMQQGAGLVQSALAKSGIDVQGLNISYGQATLSNGFSNTSQQQDGSGKNSTRSQSSRNSIRIESTDGVVGIARAISQTPDIQAKYFTAQA